MSARHNQSGKYEAFLVAAPFYPTPFTDRDRNIQEN